MWSALFLGLLIFGVFTSIVTLNAIFAEMVGPDDLPVMPERSDLPWWLFDEDPCDPMPECWADGGPVSVGDLDGLGS